MTGKKTPKLFPGDSLRHAQDPLMIIFGLSTKEKAKRAGHFDCPACGQHAPYAKLLRARRFTLFFIPIIPLGSSDTHRIVCQNCGSEYSEQIASRAA